MPEVRPIDANALHAKIFEENRRNYAAIENVAQILLRIETAPTIEAEPVRHGRWIPCSEKRPDLWGEYLTYNAENGAMYVLSFSPADNTFGIYDGNVTHWMPLPEPPEKE